MDLLTELIQTTKEPKEQLQALAVQMLENNYTYREIQNILNVSVGFISKCKKVYDENGVSELKLRYSGTKGYLRQKQKDSVLTWLKTLEWWSIDEVYDYIQENYRITFESKQSYYHFLHQAGLSGKKSQRTHPNIASLYINGNFEIPILIQQRLVLGIISATKLI
jgi:putative transposase